MRDELAKKAKKCYDKKKSFVAPGRILDYCPQWIPKAPKHFAWDQMSHAQWVAAWWSRALSQLAAQGHAEAESLSVALLLTEFLNANKVAIESTSRTAWEYDSKVWSTTAERAARRDPDLDITEIFMVTNENDLLQIKNKITKGQKGQGTQWKAESNVRGGGSPSWAPTDYAKKNAGGKGNYGKNKVGKGKGKKSFVDSVFPPPKVKEERR